MVLIGETTPASISEPLFSRAVPWAKEGSSLIAVPFVATVLSPTFVRKVSQEGLIEKLFDTKK